MWIRSFGSPPRACASFAASLGLVLIVTSAAFADSSVSGRTVAFVSHEGFPLDPCCEIDPSVTIPRGRKGRVLKVEATFQANINVVGPNVCPNQPKSVELFPVVNGVGLEPSSFITAHNNCAPCSDAFCLLGCGTSGNFWIDLDQAEAAHPGLFIGQPLNVVLIARSFGNAGGCQLLTSASMSAELVTK